jgi:hypothetical protein
MLVTVKITAFLDVMLCCVAEIYMTCHEKIWGEWRYSATHS